LDRNLPAVATRRSGRALTLALAAMVALAAGPALGRGSEGPFAQQLAPGAWLERCVPLVFGEQVAYRFSATAPLKFSVGMPLGDGRKRPPEGDNSAAPAAPDETAYALQRDGVVMLALTFRAPLDGKWCWRWSNGTDAGVQLEGTVERISAGAP
jgi:hypothetical protein